MANKSIVRIDRVRSIYNGHLESIVYNGELQNGWVAQVGGVVSGNRDLRQAVQPKAGEGRLVLIAAPEINVSEYVKTDARLDNFFIPAGKPARAYHLESGDVFSVTYEGLTLIGNEAKVGNYLVAQDGFKLKEVETLTGEEGFVGKILDIEQLGTTTLIGQPGTVGHTYKYVGIEVIKN